MSRGFCETWEPRSLFLVLPKGGRGSALADVPSCHRDREGPAGTRQVNIILEVSWNGKGYGAGQSGPGVQTIPPRGCPRSRGFRDLGTAEVCARGVLTTRLCSPITDSSETEGLP